MTSRSWEDFVTAAESDLASSNAKELLDALTCPKALLHFTQADGTGMHREMLNRSMANRQILDWLDDTPGRRTSLSRLRAP